MPLMDDRGRWRMAEEKEPKTLGQVAYEAMHHGHYPALSVAERIRWEIVGQTVWSAVLAEQAEPPGPKGMAEQEARVRGEVMLSVKHTLIEVGALSDQQVWGIALAIENGVLAGLKAWEVR